MRRVLILALALAPAAVAETVLFHRIQPEVLERRLQRVTANNQERAAVLRDLFAEAGCPAERYAEHKVHGSKLPNVSCTLPGESPITVLVGAHYDMAGPGKGAVDNWSGAALLASLYESLSQHPRKLTFLFVGFADEEKGLIGARSWVRDAGKAGVANLRAMINIDSIGVTPAKVWSSRSDKQLLQFAGMVAASTRLQLTGMNVDGVGDTDSHPFKDKKVPVLDFHSLTDETLSILHSKDDTLDKIDRGHYGQTYQIIAVLLAYLDLKPPSP